MKKSNDSFGFLVNDIARLMKQSFYANLEHGNLTLAQSRALIFISRNEGVRQVDIADMMEIKPITLARLIDQLSDVGLVERRQDPNDRRAYRLFLTNEAAPHLEKIAEYGESLRVSALAGLSPEEEAQLMAALFKVRLNLINN